MLWLALLHIHFLSGAAGLRSSLPAVSRRPPNRVSHLKVSESFPPSTTNSFTGEQVLDWSFLDAVYLITCPNADPNSDRLNKAIDVLQDVGLGDIVQVKEFQTDDENRIRGCYMSHVSLLSEALSELGLDGDVNTPKPNLLDSLFQLSNGSNKLEEAERDARVLVLEDNLASTGSLKQTLIDSVAQYTESENPWDVVHLSYNPYVPNLVIGKTAFDNIVKLTCGTGSALGTTAYIINKQAMRKILKEHDERGFYAPIPDVMADLFPESRYAVNPTIFVRAPTTKSLVNPQLDGLRELLFRPVVASAAQRLMVLTGLSTNLLLPLCIGFLVVASIFSSVSAAGEMWNLATTGTFRGPILLPILSTLFTVFALLVLYQGMMLAPKPPSNT